MGRVSIAQAVAGLKDSQTGVPAPNAGQVSRRHSSDKFPPAFRLACACCAWPPSAARDEAVRAAAAGVDWERFLRVVMRQRIAGLAQAALRSAGVNPPAEAEAQLIRLVQAASYRALALASESVRLQALLQIEGVTALFIKGAALAQLAYGSEVLKHSRDIDLLVGPDDAERVYGVLEREGYRPIVPKGPLTADQRRLVFRLHKDMELYHPQRRLNIELHWRLIDNPVLLRAVNAASPSQEVEVLNGRLATLADPLLFAYLATHGATHCWFRLKWLADLNAWLSSKPDADVARFYACAESLDVEACAGQALRLCQRLLGYSIPAGLEPRLAGKKLRGMVEAALDAMIGPDGEVELARRPFGPFRLLAPQFSRGRGARFFLAQCRLLIDNLEDKLDYPLPPALHFLYPTLRLPFWVLRLQRRRRLAA
jgi:Uncharacterised nucleotidyltransferase